MRFPLALYIISLIFSSTNGIVANKTTLTSYDVVFFRAFFAFLLQGALFLTLKKGKFTFLDSPEKKKSFVFLFLAGIFQGINWIFLFEAYATIGVSLGVLLGYCGPIFIMIFSYVLFKEKITLAKICGFIIVFFGMVLVNGRILTEGNSTWGIVCGIIGAIFFAAMNISNKLATKIEGTENSVILFFAASITIFIYMLFKRGPVLPHPAQPDVLPIIYLGFISTGIGNHLYFSSMKNLKAQTVAIWGYLEPVCAVILSFLLLNESMTALQLVGVVCILGGALFCELKG